MSAQGTIKRYILLIRKIYSPSPPNFKELSDYLEDNGFNISARTLQRDLEQIRNEFGIEIGYDRKTNSYRLQTEGLENNEKNLVSFLELIVTTEALSEGFKMDKEMLNYIDLENKGKIFSVSYLSDLLVAIKRKAVIELNHYNYEKKKSSQYTLHPYLLKEYAGRWYLIAKLHNKDEFRTFGLDRIQYLLIKENNYKPIQNFDCKTLFENVIGLNYSNEEAEWIEFELSDIQAKYIESLPLHPSQKKLKENNYAIFVIPNFELRQKFLMMGEQVRVRKPTWFADEIKSVLRNALKNYRN